MPRRPERGGVGVFVRSGDMMVLFVTGKLLLGVASAGFGASLGFAVKNWLERQQVGD